LEFIGNDSAKKYIQKLPKVQRKNFKILFPHASDDCIDLLNKMLTFDPNKRLSVKECLEHN